METDTQREREKKRERERERNKKSRSPLSINGHKLNWPLKNKRGSWTALALC